MFRYAFVVLCFVPTLVYGIEWDEFHLFYRDNRGTVLLVLSEKGEAEEKHDGQGYVVDVSIKKPLLGYYVSKRNSEPRVPSFKTPTCQLSIFHDPYLRCASSGGPLSGASFKGTKYNAGEQVDPNAAKDVRRLFGKYINIMEYGGLGMSFRCIAGCAASTPRLIILVWHGD
jgi:hypothetical protein